MFTAALFTIAKIWKQLKCPGSIQQMNYWLCQIITLCFRSSYLLTFSFFCLWNPHPLLHLLNSNSVFQDLAQMVSLWKMMYSHMEFSVTSKLLLIILLCLNSLGEFITLDCNVCLLLFLSKLNVRLSYSSLCSRVPLSGKK